MRIFLILLLVSLAGCADEARRAREADEQRELAVAELTARGTAQSLAAASLLGRFKHARRSQELIDRAVVIAPDQPALAYVQWRECAAVPTCAKEEEIRTRLQAVAPDNGLVWLPELNAAWERADAPAVTGAVMLASSRIRVLHVDRDSARRLEAMRQSNDELDVMRAMLAFHHEPLEPPANWRNPYTPSE